jgi:hypothetical protein
VVVVDDPEGGANARVVTVGSDGSNMRIIRASLNLHGAPPAWKDETHVAWVETAATPLVGLPYPVVYAAEDAPFAGESARQVELDCYDAMKGQRVLEFINQIEYGAGGLLVSGGPQYKSTGGAIHLYRMTEKRCAANRPLATGLPGGEEVDFTLSPDGLTVAFASTRSRDQLDAGLTVHDIHLVPSDGGQPARYFAGEPADDDVGPRWIAGGSQLAWLSVDAQGRAALKVVNADGTNLRTVLAAPGNGSYVAAGSNAGLSCAVAPGGATGGDGLLVLLALALVAAQRRARYQ